MKIILSILLLTTIHTHAIMIEDSAIRLEFELFWGPPQPILGSVNLNLGPEYVRPGLLFGFTGSAGSGIWLDQPSGNQYWYALSIQRAIDGVVQPATFSTVVFRTTRDQFDNFNLVGDPVFGPNITFSSVLSAFPIPDNPYAARIVLGQPHGVPDTGSTLLLLFSALAGMGFYQKNWRHIP